MWPGLDLLNLETKCTHWVLIRASVVIWTNACGNLFWSSVISICWLYSKTCVNGHSKIDITNILMTNGSLMKVESIAECSPWSILQHFWPALSDNWSWKPIFGLLRVAVLHRFHCICMLFCIITGHVDVPIYSHVISTSYAVFNSAFVFVYIWFDLTNPLYSKWTCLP